MPEPTEPLDLNVVGATTATHVHSYGWRELATYALGIGATRAELPYLYEGSEGGIRVYPTYAVVPAYPAVIELLERVGARATQLIHTGQQVVQHRSPPPEGTLETRGRLAGLYDLKRFARLDIETQTQLDGEPIFDTTWTIVVREAGRFGGPRPPPRRRAPQVPRNREPDWVVEHPTHPEQTLLYRLSGDPNPLHVDDALARSAGFERGAILHGLCTYGHVARAAIDRAGAGDGARMRSLTVSFRRPLWPGDTIRTAGFHLPEGVVALQVTAGSGGEPVLGDAWAQFDPGGPTAHPAAADPT